MAGAACSLPTKLPPTVWETYEHHKALMERPDYPDLIQALKPAVAGKLDMQHVEFDIDFAAALEAPVTEIAIFKLKPDTSRDKFLSIFKNLREEIIKGESCHSVIWGESKENSGTFVLMIGWDSIQVYYI